MLKEKEEKLSNKEKLISLLNVINERICNLDIKVYFIRYVSQSPYTYTIKAIIILEDVDGFNGYYDGSLLHSGVYST